MWWIVCFGTVSCEYSVSVKYSVSIVPPVVMQRRPPGREGCFSGRLLRSSLQFVSSGRPLKVSGASLPQPTRLGVSSIQTRFDLETTRFGDHWHSTFRFGMQLFGMRPGGMWSTRSQKSQVAGYSSSNQAFMRLAMRSTRVSPETRSPLLCASTSSLSVVPPMISGRMP